MVMNIKYNRYSLMLWKSIVSHSLKKYEDHECQTLSCNTHYVSAISTRAKMTFPHLFVYGIYIYVHTCVW